MLHKFNTCRNNIKNKPVYQAYRLNWHNIKVSVKLKKLQIYIADLGFFLLFFFLIYW